ncbi:NADH dehydrogenase [ubiquinone] 1 beta subcomplex subunit 2, mitochondrial [Formica fusca]|uniref:NADH dehydrogenase [ubiquinone] 1 beta subcomplex subunit 2, mitochondrial-like n=1 Tax=Formica exsecta TaxID=72781 RepID=UPI0011439D9D|nr:NADH dehydrogenase [ubiquinone] 1 beta subcomplex subunit 2, mitochondrial-like [Formica exsecta]XP_029663329.1 NADH dehydrogenase [ubiquinone] 1 beta subcomplex subunit 2, mitochondrial-like [Formica exsecta]XP_029663330.1 NADH dehydrogenase [ubiquinone] 1 beta subcomplex subunit 2, mitochondrial-like [Formica exsecta]
MIISRGLNLLRIGYRNSQSKVSTTNLRSVRLSHDDYHGTYRGQIPPVEKIWLYGAEIMGGVMWWWVLWHFWHDFGHIVGEFPYPDPSKWTDEELGIPPDDYEEPATRV